MYNERLFMGIDPGQSGGIVVIDAQGSIKEVVKMPPTPKDIYDFICKWQQEAHSICACLEDVGRGMPGQSSAATAKFARHNGHLEMALIASGMRFATVTPNKWEKAYQLGKSKDHTHTEWKNLLKAKAQQLFPNVKVTLWNADALLIAEYLRRKEVGG